MPFKEALFWIGLTVFGTGLYFIFEGDQQKLILSLAMIVVGGFVAGYSIYAYHHPDKQLPIWVYLLLLTWVALSFDFYDRHYSTPPVSQQFVQPIITATNLEANVRHWLDEFHYSVKKRDDSSAYFGFDIVLPNSKTVTLSQQKDRDNFLLIAADVGLGPQLINTTG
jgi:hypothetical protein